MFVNKHNLKELGLLNLVITIPAVLSPTFIGLGLIAIQNILNINFISSWIENIIYIPILITPLFYIYSIVIGIINIKEKNAVCCIVMSIASMLIFVFFLWILLLLAEYN